MTRKHKSIANLAEWKLTFTCDGDVISKPEDGPDQLKVKQKVYLTFENKSDVPLIMGVIATGRRFTDNNNEKPDGIVDTDERHCWIKDGEVDSGTTPIAPGGSQIVLFTVEDVEPEPGEIESWFFYCCFGIGHWPSHRRARRRKKGRPLWGILGRAIDPHVIITS
jgi:hypothetical protein